MVDKKLNDKDAGESKPPLDSEEGTARRRDAAIKRMLETPPRQHQEDVGKAAQKRSNQTGVPEKGKAEAK